VTGRVLLVRHTEVVRRWRDRCYGSSDIGLSLDGRQRAYELAATLAREPVTALVHSGLERAAFLAQRLALLKRIEPSVDARWRERDFGTWEGRTWHSIWRETGNAMDGMLTHPDRYRPGEGETTAELAERSIAAWRALPHDGLVVVITHGGPIAAIRSVIANAPMSEMASFSVTKGTIVRL
jgi:broad specificity phosphatase PhoE